MLMKVRNDGDGSAVSYCVNDIASIRLNHTLQIELTNTWLRKSIIDHEIEITKLSRSRHDAQPRIENEQDRVPI